MVIFIGNIIGSIYGKYILLIVICNIYIV